MVAAQLVCSGEGLRERLVWGGRGVDFYAGRAGGGKDLGGCYGEGEDVGDVGWGGQVVFFCGGVEGRLPSSIVCVVRYCLDWE